MELSTSSDFKVLLVGHLFPARLELDILDQPIPPVQTQRFGMALLDALKNGFNGSVEILSVAPLLGFPKSRFLLAPKAKWKFDGDIRATMIPFINIVGLKHLTRFVGTFLFVAFWTLRNRKHARIIVMHGVQSCKIWGVLFGQAFAPCMTIPFVTDNLGIPLAWESNFSKLLRRLDIFLMKSGLGMVSGVIAMTKKLAETLAPKRPSLIMPTIQNAAISRHHEKQRCSDGTFTIVYAGGLFYNYGVNLLLDAFEQANRPEWHLVIAGSGDLEETVRDFAANNPAVEYAGFLNSKEMAELYRVADVLVNPRLTSTPIAEMAFPSKLVEYLSTGKPVVSTDLPALDESFRRHLIIAKSDSPEELIRCLDEILSWGDDQREAWQAKTFRFLQDELSPTVQGVKIRRFIESLKNLNIQ